MRLLWIFLGLGILMLIPFLIWGGDLEQAFSGPAAVNWLKGYGRWAWAAGLLLLLSDLLLPVPGTAVMAALGFVYGPLVGGFVGALGSFLSGHLAYVLCRLMGHDLAVRLVGKEDLIKGEHLFARAGGWIVAWSRWLPLLPEVIACMAGLARMPLLSFSLAMACGCLPMGFTFAAIGHSGVDHPGLALILSAAVPPILWLLARPIIRSKTGPMGRTSPGQGETI